MLDALMKIINDGFGRPVPQPQGASVPEMPPVNAVGVPIAIPYSMPPRFPAVYPEFPDGERVETTNKFDNFEPAWGDFRMQQWEGRPLQFFTPRIPFQVVAMEWNPVLGWPAPSIERGEPGPLQYVLGSR